MLFASYDFFKSIILYLLLTSIFSLKTDVSLFRNIIAFPKYVDSVHFTLKVLYILLSLKHLYFIYLFRGQSKGGGARESVAGFPNACNSRAVAGQRQVVGKSICVSHNDKRDLVT